MGNNNQRETEQNDGQRQPNETATTNDSAVGGHDADAPSDGTSLPRRRFLTTAAVAGLGASFPAGVATASSQKWDVDKFSLDENWVTTYLDHSYDNPAVIAGPLSYAGSDPSHVRLKDIETTSFNDGDKTHFDAKVEEWEYLNGYHTNETVSSLVMEEGVHYSDGGTNPFEVGTVDVTDTMDWTSVSFDAYFDDPVVFSTVQTYNGSHSIVTRNRNVWETGFEVTIQEEEALGGHTTETVGYLVVEDHEAGTFNGRQWYSFSDGVDENWTDVLDLSGTDYFGDDPIFLLDMQTTNGVNTAGLRYRIDSTETLQTFVEEEQSSDDETGHTDEIVGGLVIENY